jgi:glycosyltransferase involved in cell wall biosynthesis
MNYTVIIPAFNEERYLPTTLSALMLAMKDSGLPGQVIVVDNNSTDDTARVAADHGAQVVFEPVNQISRARNAGAAVADTPYLIFIDADTSISGPLLAAALTALASGKVCGGGSTLVFDHTPPRAEYMVRSWTWISRHLKIAAGSFIFCLREGFDDVGGFSEAVYASEEIWFSRNLKRWGRQRELGFEVLDIAPVVTSARKLEWFTPWRFAIYSLAMVFLPFLVRFKSACGPWYQRPDIDEE